jgi:CPA2 family monovalent cation:H+ antiporter-2
MTHDTPLISLIVAGLVLAFAFGALAQKLRLSPIVGYLVAGVAVGPFTPGFVGNAKFAAELSELGVILLMFGVGLHFSLADLYAVRRVAVPGALGQMAVAAALGVGLSTLLGWDFTAGLVFGLALSVASTVVLLRALEQVGLVETERGRIAVGWLIVEDLAMVLALVLLPALANGGVHVATGSLGGDLAFTLFKVAAFVAVMLVLGRRVVPKLLDWAAAQGSQELFTLAVLATALGVAFGAASLFGVSFALGAFFAGVTMAESPLSRRAAEDVLPLRDAFAVLFFVSAGMLFDPGVVVREPVALIATLAIVVLGKGAAAFAIVRAFGRSSGTAAVIGASLAQIGEFSFILVALGGELGVLPQTARDLVIAAAILSIVAHPFVFGAAVRFANSRA